MSENVEYESLVVEGRLGNVQANPGNVEGRMESGRRLRFNSRRWIVGGGLTW